MNAFFLSVRALHVLVGAIWLGTAVFVSYFLMPALQQVGPDSGKVMQALLRRRMDMFVPTIAGLTVLSGLWLYWHFTDGFDPGISSTMGGRVFGMGGVIGIVAAIIGSRIPRMMKRALALMQQAADQADAGQRSALIEQAGQLRRKAMASARIAVILLVVTIVLMSLGHYV
jgi:uncharacterized membrane protein